VRTRARVVVAVADDAGLELSGMKAKAKVLL